MRNGLKILSDCRTVLKTGFRIGIVIFFVHSAGHAYESKWTRVDVLAKSLTSGEAWTRAEASRRLQVKEDIIEILYAQEAGYPIYYVDSRATGSNNGSSWSNAFKRIQDGIDAASNGGEGWVWVAEGTYTSQTEPRITTSLDTYTLTGAIQVLPGVMLFGGFTGSETLLEQRDPSTQVTAIQGWVGHSSQSIGLRGVEMGHKTLIDGFLIKDSGFDNIKNTESSIIDGGGIKTRQWFSVIRNNRITRCHGKNGGGLAVMAYYNYDVATGRITIDPSQGAQIYPGYCPIIEKNIIYRNHAVCGAGVQIRIVEALFCNNIVAYNSHTPLTGEQIKHKGIEIFTVDAVCDRPVLVNNIVWGNALESGLIQKNIYQYDNYRPDTFGEDGYFGYNNCVQMPSDAPKNGDRGYLENVDPLFVNASANNFSLNSSSPCIGAGLLMPDGSQTDIGIYLLRYMLTINDGGIGANKTGHGMQLALSSVTISTDSMVTDAPGTTRYKFQQWTGSGSGSYTGSLRTSSVVMNEEITETITWKKQYKLNVQSGTTADALAGWYNESASVTVTVPTVLDEGDVRRRFIQWTIQANGSTTTSTSAALPVTMNSPVALTAVWSTEYKVHVQSPYGIPTVPQDQWITAGSTVNVSIELTVNGVTGTRYAFQRWEGQGQSAYSGTNAAFSITVNSPVSETAVWQTQYHLTVISESGRGSPQGDAWYAAGANATISVDSTVQANAQQRYRFSRWQGTGTGAFTGTDRIKQITVNNPIVETVIWNTEYAIIVQTTPAGTGNVATQNVNNGWGVLGSQITLRAEGNSSLGYGFASWSGSFSGRINPLVFQLSQPVQVTARFEPGNVHVETMPSVLSITVDGAEFPSPRVFYWQAGDQYTLGAPSPQSTDTLTRQVYNRWSDGLPQQHKVTIPVNSVIYTAFFNPEYRVAVQTTHGKQTVQGTAVWYTPGTSANISVDSLVQENSGTRYRFTGWTAGNAYGVNASACHVTIPMQGGAVQIAHWQTQYQLKTTVSPAYGGSISVSNTGSWFDSGAAIQVTAIPRDANFTFTGWTGDIQSTQPVLVLSMNRAYSLTANFYTSTLFPPEISSFPDTTVFEDNPIRFARSRLEKMVKDPNDPLENLQASVINPVSFSAQWDGTELKIIPAADWNGLTDVVLQFSDPWGMSATDTFKLNVVAIPDPPKDFSLRQPMSQTELADSVLQVKFTWETARNVDSPDAVSYQFFLGQDSLFINSTTLRISSVQDTFLFLNRSLVPSKSYWRVRAVDQQGFSTWSTERFSITIKTSAVGDPVQPAQFAIKQNYPNPFNATTQIVYSLPRRDHVRILIYDARGCEVCVLADAFQEAGDYRLTWSGRDQRGMDVPSGIYFVKTAWQGISPLKMLLIR